jgi:hypothetical protein
MHRCLSGGTTPAAQVNEAIHLTLILDIAPGDLGGTIKFLYFR